MTESSVALAERTGNDLLDALDESDRARLLCDLEAVPLSLGDTIYDPNETISHVHFPTQGIISMVSHMERGTVEVGAVGREGMAGLPVLLQADSMPTRAFVQVKGHSLRLTAERFREAMRDSATFARLMFRYAQSLFDQVAQSVACNRLHTLEERCARWILMTHDRVGTDDIALTHRFLAEMLGVHRPAVTLAAGVLQQAGLISHKRGTIRVLDRERLEMASCACYGITKASMDRLRAMGAT